VTIHTFASSNESAICSQLLFPEALKAPQFLSAFRARLTGGC
jgi:hypothetical protein